MDANDIGPDWIVMEIRFLGGAREVGRSAVLINDSLLLDYGQKPGTPPQFPVGSPDPDAVVVSHGHLDHAGAVPALLSGRDPPSVHLTPPTFELTLLLARDTLKLHGGSYNCPFTEEDVKRLTESAVTHGYVDSFEAAGHTVTFFDAGHIPGSAHILVDDGTTRLLYTGDFHTDNQRIVTGTDARPGADVVLCESTYSDVTHADRSELEESFVEAVRTTLWDGGTVVVPAFAIGRTQELMLICAANDIDCYVDGMGTEVARLLLRHPEFIRSEPALRRAKGHSRFVTGEEGQRARITESGSVIITTSGMLTGGPAMTYVPAVHSNPANLIALTGYQVAGTPGRELIERGSADIDGRRLSVSARVRAYDFSAHADQHGLRQFLDAYRDSKVLLNHGERCEVFAEELDADGYDVTAPALGTVVSL